ncbi:hypothetical protein ACEQ8H_004771 [Pleosporales sp. CAS-2024a]
MSSPQTARKIALIGGSGSVGSHILDALLASGKHSITILTRTDSTSKFPPNVAVEQVDYASDESIKSALSGQDFLIITLPGTAPADLHPRILQAAAAVGVRYIMPNYFGYALASDRPNQPLPNPMFNFERHVDDVRAVASHGVKFVTLACGFWYEWSLGMSEAWYGFDISGRKVTFYDDGLKKINTSTWKLCGEAVAKVLSGDLTP